jgi:hypothetical protein
MARLVRMAREFSLYIIIAQQHQTGATNIVQAGLAILIMGIGGQIPQLA